MQPESSTVPPAASAAHPHEDLFCPGCGYNVRGVPSGRCPECGRKFDPAVLAAVRLPWSRRKQLGFFRAYWRTVKMASLNNCQFCQEINHELSYSDARRFWAVTVAHAWVPFAIATAIAIAVTPPSWDMIGLVILGHLGLIAALFATTGVACYFAHPRRLDIAQQNRAIALSLYGCASLAWAPLAIFIGAVLALIASVFLESERWETGMVLIMLAPVVPIIMLGAWYFDTLHIIHTTTQRSRRGIIAIGVVLPLLWLLLAALALAVPAMLIYLTLLAAALA